MCYQGGIRPSLRLAKKSPYFSMSVVCLCLSFCSDMILYKFWVCLKGHLSTGGVLMLQSRVLEQGPSCSPHPCCPGGLVCSAMYRTAAYHDSTARGVTLDSKLSMTLNLPSGHGTLHLQPSELLKSFLAVESSYECCCISSMGSWSTGRESLLCR